MPLLNYTTKIEVEKTVGEIQKCLAKHGAQSIMTDYSEGLLVGIKSSLLVNEQTIGFKLPCDWRPVLAVMKNDAKIPRKLIDQYQAVRVAWRIVKDWVEAQMALVDTQMVKTEEVFLPYLVVKGGQTLFEQVSNNQFRLGSGN